MQATNEDVRTETAQAPIEWVGSRAGSKCARVTIDGEPMELRIPKGTRGVKVGAQLVVRIEWRTWYEVRRMTFNMLKGTSSESVERNEYHDGVEHPHYYVERAV